MKRSSARANSDIVIYNSIADKVGIVTANSTTPYIIGFGDLSRTWKLHKLGPGTRGTA